MRDTASTTTTSSTTTGNSNNNKTNKWWGRLRGRDRSSLHRRSSLQRQPQSQPEPQPAGRLRERERRQPQSQPEPTDGEERRQPQSKPQSKPLSQSTDESVGRESAPKTDKETYFTQTNEQEKNMSYTDNTSLATLLRKCAMLVERNETLPILLQAAGSLQAYHARENSKSNNHFDENPTSPFSKTPNSKSVLLANGWVELRCHHHRKVTWKEVLASLVEARRPGEETTLWIQREMRNPHNQTPHKYFEGLHQIPMKWIEEVFYLDSYADYFCFSIKVFNVPENFVFRTGNEDSCRQWVDTLKRYAMVTTVEESWSNSKQASASPRRGTEVESQPQQQPQPSVGVEPQPKVRMTIKELRAITHSVGQDTRGMERADLEKIAARYNENMLERVKEQAAAQAAVEMNEDILQRVKEQAAAKAALEMNEDILKRVKEQAAAEMKRRADFVNEWTGENTNNDTSQKSFSSARYNSMRFNSTQSDKEWGRGVTSPTSSTDFPPPPTPPQPPSLSKPPQQTHQPPETGDPTLPINHKYAKAAQLEKGEVEVTFPAIERNILIHWALIPPKYNMLRTIDHLLCNIHTVFPPAFGINQHSYFTKWRQIAPTDLVMSSTMGNSTDRNKLKKAMRKLRVFLHPDRLPRDFNTEHTFVCKMLWDLANDAWEDFLKIKDMNDMFYSND